MTALNNSKNLKLLYCYYKLAIKLLQEINSTTLWWKHFYAQFWKLYTLI